MQAGTVDVVIPITYMFCKYAYTINKQKFGKLYFKIKLKDQFIKFFSKNISGVPNLSGAL